MLRTLRRLRPSAYPGFLLWAEEHQIVNAGAKDGMERYASVEGRQPSAAGDGQREKIDIGQLLSPLKML